MVEGKIMGEENNFSSSYLKELYINIQSTLAELDE